jgi:hypothetical protein
VRGSRAHTHAAWRSIVQRFGRGEGEGGGDPGAELAFASLARTAHSPRPNSLAGRQSTRQTAPGEHTVAHTRRALAHPRVVGVELTLFLTRLALSLAFNELVLFRPLLLRHGLGQAC